MTEEQKPTAMGLKYAKMIVDGQIVWQDDVPKRRRADAYYAYGYMRYQPAIEPPTE